MAGRVGQSLPAPLMNGRRPAGFGQTGTGEVPGVSGEPVRNGQSGPVRHESHDVIGTVGMTSPCRSQL